MKKTTLLLSTLIFFAVSTFAQQEAPAKSGSASASTTPDKLSWRKNRKLAKKSLKKGSWKQPPLIWKPVLQKSQRKHTSQQH
jgi:hypothetical protein